MTHVLFVSTGDTAGGAARASYRLFRALRTSDLDATMFVLSKTSDDPSVFTPRRRLALPMRIAADRLEALPLRRFPPRPVFWSLNWAPYPVGPYLKNGSPDILHLHWIGGGFIPINVLGRVDQPILWTLHDEWAFTGGCHYAYDCIRFMEHCGACPQLQSTDPHDISRRTWERKFQAFQRLNITIAAPSRWIAERARSSGLFRNCRIEVIPNGIDTAVYKPVDQAFARNVLNLPQDKKLILFGALSSTSDKRKGYELLRSAIAELAKSEWATRAEVVMFGASTFAAERADFALPMHVLGVLQDDVTLALAYAASDVFVAPSLQDNLPNTVMEALTCGTPTVAFMVGGMSDLITHQVDGYLAQPYDAHDLAHAMTWILEDGARRKAFAREARDRAVARFDDAHIATRYATLYQDLIEKAQAL